jgi:hypothetical protein
MLASLKFVSSSVTSFSRVPWSKDMLALYNLHSPQPEALYARFQIRRCQDFHEGLGESDSCVTADVIGNLADSMKPIRAYSPIGSYGSRTVMTRLGEAAVKRSLAMVAISFELSNYGPMAALPSQS